VPSRARARAGKPPGRRPASPAPARAANLSPARERALVAVLIAIHVALVVWGIASNSVTFDENFHLPAGVAIVTRHDFSVSLAQPPLVKSLCAMAALAAGAHAPVANPRPANAEYGAGAEFEQLNADRYTRVYDAARLVIAALSVLLALIVWRWSRHLYGARGALLSLAAYAFAPEAIAHAGIVGMDLATALGTTAALYAFWRFARFGEWRWWLLTALATGATLLTRFSAVQLAPAMLILAGFGTATHRMRRPGRVWIGLALIPLTSLVLLNAGYLGQTSFDPLSHWQFRSAVFQSLQRSLPGLRVPIPDDCLLGLDYLSSLQAEGITTTYLFGRITHTTYWYYVPFALLIKWPVGFLGLIAARLGFTAMAPAGPRRSWHDLFLWIPAVTFLLIAMFVAHLDVGIRYVLPALPLLCVWIGGLATLRIAPARRPVFARFRVAALLLIALAAAECVASAPYELSFFNRLAGSHPDRLINDSNVDWGQGLIALRSDMKRLGIRRLYLAYHGTTDPLVYGIDYIPYTGGMPGTGSDWFAVSSFYFVGLAQRMVVPKGRTLELVHFDFHALWDQQPIARPARCMYLFRLR
jgi:hypothetical protein